MMKPSPSNEPARSSQPPAEPALIVKLTPAEHRALLGFLDRSTMTGKEAPAFLRIKMLISGAVPLPETQS